MRLSEPAATSTMKQVRRFAVFARRHPRRRALVLAALLASVASHAIACSPPPPHPVVEGPTGTLLPRHDASDFAFLGKVVGHTQTAAGVPALAVEVLDPWTARQRRGEIVTIAVDQWQGCNLPRPMGERFQPARYPLGTRVRIVSPESTIYSWDVNTSIAVLGVVR